MKTLEIASPISILFEGYCAEPVGVDSFDPNEQYICYYDSTGEINSRYRVNPVLAKILEYMNIKVDLNELNNKYLNEVKSGTGDIYVYCDNKNSCAVFDLYEYPDDQMDIIRFGVICSDEQFDQLYELFVMLVEEINKKLRFSEYDITQPGMLKAVMSGEKTAMIGSYVQSVIYK